MKSKFVARSQFKFFAWHILKVTRFAPKIGLASLRVHVLPFVRSRLRSFFVMVSRVEFDARADGTTPDREDLDERGANERERERECVSGVCRPLLCYSDSAFAIS